MTSFTKRISFLAALFVLGVGATIFTVNAVAQSATATIPSVIFTSSGSGIELSASDAATTGFDVYVDNQYLMSFTLDSAQTPIVFTPAADYCEVSAAAWTGGGIGHSPRSAPLLNVSNAACATSTGIVSGSTTTCVDSVAYDQASGAILNGTTYCF